MSNDSENVTPGFLPMPAGKLTIPAESENFFPVRHTDWVRVRRHMAQTSGHESYFSNLGWTSIGISAAAILAYFPWAAAASQLPTAEQTHYAYISPVLIVAAIAAFVVAIVCFLANSNSKRAEVVSVKSVCEEMDEIYEPHKPTGFTLAVSSKTRRFRFPGKRQHET